MSEIIVCWFAGGLSPRCIIWQDSHGDDHHGPDCPNASEWERTEYARLANEEGEA